MTVLIALAFIAAVCVLAGRAERQAGRKRRVWPTTGEAWAASRFNRPQDRR